jgi:hypothetical protein
MHIVVRILVLSTILYLFLLSGISADVALAGVPPAIPTPRPSDNTPVSQTQPTGAYGPAVPTPVPFQPYTKDIHNSAGLVVGNLTGIDYDTVRLLVYNDSIIDGEHYSVNVRTDLTSTPADLTVDLNTCDSGILPGGMNNVKFLCAARVIVHSSNDLQATPGTLSMKFTVPASCLDGDVQDTDYYFVYYDGAGYQIQTPKVTAGNNIATIEADITGINGALTLVMPVLPVQRSNRATPAAPAGVPMVSIPPTTATLLTSGKESTGIIGLGFLLQGLVLINIAACISIGLRILKGIAGLLRIKRKGHISLSLAH